MCSCQDHARHYWGGVVHSIWRLPVLTVSNLFAPPSVTIAQTLIYTLPLACENRLWRMLKCLFCMNLVMNPHVPQCKGICQLQKAFASFNGWLICISTQSLMVLGLTALLSGMLKHMTHSSNQSTGTDCTYTVTYTCDCFLFDLNFKLSCLKPHLWPSECHEAQALIATFLLHTPLHTHEWAVTGRQMRLDSGINCTVLCCRLCQPYIAISPFIYIYVMEWNVFELDSSTNLKTSFDPLFVRPPLLKGLTTWKHHPQSIASPTNKIAHLVHLFCVEQGLKQELPRKAQHACFVWDISLDMGTVESSREQLSLARHKSLAGLSCMPLLDTIVSCTAATESWIHIHTWRAIPLPDHKHAHCLCGTLCSWLLTKVLKVT